MTSLKQIRESIAHVKVLYVEDEDEVRSMTMQFLKKIFTHVDSAVDGQEGLDLFKENDYDMVITDLKMPRMNGRVMLSEIKELDKDVVLLVMTASDSRMDVTETVCDGYLNKPVLISEFIEIIEPLKDRLQKKSEAG